MYPPPTIPIPIDLALVTFQCPFCNRLQFQKTLFMFCRQEPLYRKTEQAELEKF
jgi:hypothetical protein